MIRSYYSWFFYVLGLFHASHSVMGMKEVSKVILYIISIIPIGACIHVK